MTASLLLILVAAFLIGGVLTIVCGGMFTDRSRYEEDSRQENGTEQDPQKGEHSHCVERHAMSKKGPETKKAEKSRENIKKAQFYVGFHAKPGDKLQKGA